MLNRKLLEFMRLTKGITDEEVIATIVRSTGGNFRLLHRLLAQVGRVLEINGLDVVTRKVVEAARESGHRRKLTCLLGTPNNSVTPDNPESVRQQENTVGYQEAFRDVVLKPLREDEAIQQEVHQYLVAYQQSRTEFSSFDHYIRMKILGYARTPCQTPALALLYSYTYMPMHMDGNKKVIEREYETFFQLYLYQKPANVWMIDVGCGPMTACLALSDFQQSLPTKQRLELEYVGCDLQSRMTDIAVKFHSKANPTGSLWRAFSRTATRTSTNPHWREQVDCPLTEGGTLVFYFSYFWEQVAESRKKWANGWSASSVCRFKPAPRTRSWFT